MHSIFYAATDGKPRYSLQSSPESLPTHTGKPFWFSPLIGREVKPSLEPLSPAALLEIGNGLAGAARVKMAMLRDFLMGAQERST